jgi:hypothetical protein
MLRFLGKIFALVLLLAVGATGIYFYRHHDETAVQLQREQEKSRELEQVVSRLTGEKRRAEVLVTDQKTVDGVLKTTLLFVEYAPDGRSLPPKSFTIDGKNAHIDGLLIEFDHNFVKENDPLRGHSIILFKRIYGDNQSPDQAASIDTPGEIPAVYRGADPHVSEFEQDLWKNFWKLYDDETYRHTKGVRVAMGQGVWGMFEKGKLYTITLQTDGGLTLTSEPLKGIYIEALKQRGDMPS